MGENYWSFFSSNNFKKYLCLCRIAKLKDTHVLRGVPVVVRGVVEVRVELLQRVAQALGALARRHQHRRLEVHRQPVPAGNSTTSLCVSANKKILILGLIHFSIYLPCTNNDKLHFDYMYR